MNPNGSQSNPPLQIPDVFATLINSLAAQQNTAGFSQNHQLLAALLSHNSQPLGGNIPSSISWPGPQQPALGPFPNLNGVQNARLSGMNPPQNAQQPDTGAFPSSIFSDALQLSTPVGQSPNDEDILVTALHACSSNGLNYKLAINKLHGVNNHAANLWKDYYLEHKFHIDHLVSQLSGGSAKAVKKPSYLVSEAPEPSGSASPRAGNGIKAERVSRRESHSQPSTSRRPIEEDEDFIGHFDDEQIEPPSREPSPPVSQEDARHGDKFSRADYDYFVKYLSWELHHDPGQTRHNLIVKLALNVPRHSRSSWSIYWNKNQIADKLFQAAKSRKKCLDRRAEPASRDDEDEPQEKAIHGGEDSEYTSTADSSDLPSTDDETQMGRFGESFNDVDMRVTARWIAGHSDWASTQHKDRWLPFAQKHPQRTHKSWAEYYRRNEEGLLALARRYRRRQRRRLQQEQRGRPSWAQPHRKRKSEVVDDAGGSSPGVQRKKSRGD
ncbi:hypothetical protein DENSPDRAFT_833062 [Dentipellis sp. KUC8613]|nr:hypothetical protein DENSPDRAFT_833062 [Dentipellis sp. KUC8613]